MIFGLKVSQPTPVSPIVRMHRTKLKSHIIKAWCRNHIGFAQNTGFFVVGVSIF